MTFLKSTVLGLAALAITTTTALAGDPDMAKMVGKWKWEDVTVEVSECDATGLCAKVVSGDSKCGGTMIKSKMVKDSPTQGHGDVCHPKTGETYKTVLKMDGADKVVMTGTSASGATASGTFTRVK